MTPVVEASSMDALRALQVALEGLRLRWEEEPPGVVVPAGNIDTHRGGAATPQLISSPIQC
jgi:hypothetical protein